MKSEKIYIPYHVNPAKIRSYLERLPKDQLILHGRYIRMRIKHAEPGSTKHSMFIRLYQHAKSLYLEKYHKP